MTGAEIYINGRPPVTIAADNFAYIFAFCGGASGDWLVAGGGNYGERLTWIDEALRKGDRIRIRIVETEQPSSPLKVRPNDRMKMKARYEQLKAELKAKGLIK